MGLIGENMLELFFKFVFMVIVFFLVIVIRGLCLFFMLIIL